MSSWQNVCWPAGTHINRLFTTIKYWAHHKWSPSTSNKMTCLAKKTIYNLWFCHFTFLDVPVQGHSDSVLRAGISNILLLDCVRPSLRSLRTLSTLLQGGGADIINSESVAEKGDILQCAVRHTKLQLHIFCLEIGGQATLSNYLRCQEDNTGHCVLKSYSKVTGIN